MRSVLIAADINNGVLFLAPILQSDRVVALTEKQASLVLGALSVKKMKLVADIVPYFTAAGRPLIQENMK